MKRGENQLDYSLVIKKAKFHDIGNYTMKVVSENGEHSAVTKLTVLAAKVKSRPTSAKGKQQDESEIKADEAFKKRMKRM
jgi:hypothetical protein